MIAFSQRSKKVCLHAANLVASKDLSLGHFTSHQYILKGGKWPCHQHTCSHEIYARKKANH